MKSILFIYPTLSIQLRLEAKKTQTKNPYKNFGNTNQENLELKNVENVMI